MCFVGSITLAQNLAALRLNLPMNFTYFVTASADPPRTTSAMVTVVVNVKDINAEIPVFSQVVSISLQWPGILQVDVGNFFDCYLLCTTTDAINRSA